MSGLPQDQPSAGLFGAWQRGRFPIGSYRANGVEWVDGWIAGDLGFHGCGLDVNTDEPCWSVTHLPTGHQVALLSGEFVDSISIADEIAALADWSFATMAEARAVPRLKERVREVLGRHGIGVAETPQHLKANVFVAAEVARARLQ